jgi:hypothetical protein
MACLTNYTVQCTDAATGKTGCFLFDQPHWQRTGEFLAISPVFASLAEFFRWDNANGLERKGIYLERT